MDATIRLVPIDNCLNHLFFVFSGARASKMDYYRTLEHTNPSDIRYLNVDTRVRGYGPNRLKSLELEGRWVLTPKSIPYIQAVFNQMERLNGPGKMPVSGGFEARATKVPLVLGAARAVDERNRPQSMDVRAAR